MAREEFVYRGRTSEDVDTQANQSGSSFDKFINDRFPTWKVEKGDRIVRILPPTFAKTKEDLKKYGKHWGLKVFIHRNVGPKDGQYLCLEEMKGEECPICEFAKKLEADGESDDAYKLRRQFLYIAWVIDRDDEKAGPQVWTVPWTLDREIGVRCKNKKTGEPILIDDPDDGFDVEFRRDGTGLGTKYIGVNISRESGPILEGKPKTQAKWLSFITENPLTDVLNFYDAEYLEKIVNAEAGDDDGDKPAKKKKKPAADEEDEDETPTPKKKKKPAAEEDEDEDETPPPKKKKPPVEEDEDDDAPPPKKKKPPVEEDEDETPPPKKKKPAPEEDEEDEDDDVPTPKKKPAPVEEDEDDDVPTPKKKPGGQKRIPADADEDDDEPTPPKKKKPAPVEEDEDEDASASAKAALKKVGKKKPAEEDEDEDETPPPKKKKKPPVEEDEDDD